MKKLLLVVFVGVALGFSNCFGQLTVNTTTSRFEMIKTLEGPGVVFSNVSVDCPGSEQIALFNGTNSNIGMDRGVLLTTGSVISAIGPNNATGKGFQLNEDGDPDLDSIAEVQTFDACKVEFDMETAGDSLNFDFVFASEEYPQFINNINDAFGFFISGPGINGPFLDSAINIAVLPDGVTPVSITNINNGNTNNGPCKNCQFYVSNGTGDALEPQYTDNRVVQYDGFTTVLTASHPVIPCQKYHLKLVIADAKDRLQDSGVFLKQGSFKSKTAAAKARFTRVYEGCKDAELIFLKADVDDAVTIKLSYGGTATMGVDYGLGANLDSLPSSFIVAADKDVDFLPFTIASDMEADSGETIKVFVENADCFGNFGSADSIEIKIYEKLAVNLEASRSLCSYDSAIVEANVEENDLFFDWTPARDSNESKFTTVLDAPTEFIVAVSDSFGCMGADTISTNVLFNNETFDFTYEQTEIEATTTVRFIPSSQFSSSAKYHWEFLDGSGQASFEKTPSHTFPSSGGTYEVKLTVRDVFSEDCNFEMTKFIELKDLELTNVFTPNGDGYNDYFRVGKLYGYNVKLYNRWGEIVFESENYNNDFTGGDLPDGSYFYEVITESGKSYKQWIELIR